MSISPAYALFLAAAAFCAVLVCVLYLNLQADVVSRSENVTAMQEELADPDGSEQYALQCGGGFCGYRDRAQPRDGRDGNGL